MDRQELLQEIEKLRGELTQEYEKCLDKGGINSNVIEISQRLDKLIVEYMKMTKH